LNKFIDSTTISLQSGHGGAGSVSFRREKYIEKGGPDGGDGGRGGNVILIADKKISSLLSLHSKKHLRAEDGQAGGKKLSNGRSGADLKIHVPVGTVVKNTAGDLIRDLTTDKQSFTILRGGKGGKGNHHFATSTNQAPVYAQKGLPGEEANISLEIKLIADIGLVGFPNAGKSTLISVLTNAKARIADYPFTTLTPKLGVYKLDWENSVIIADIPGLIEGAHTGKGLGIDFLKHIERTCYLFFIIEATGENPYKSFQKLRKEIKNYSNILYNKPFAIGISKIDIAAAGIESLQKKFPAELRDELYFFSGVTRAGLKQLKKIGYNILNNKPNR